MYTLFISVLVMVPAVVLHELAHGVAAFWLGDPTAKEQQRLTLNPFAHVTWFGTFVLPALLAVAGLPILGYAKPVPVDPRHFREPRKHMAWVAMAGPLTNIVLAFACVLFINFVLPWAQPGSNQQPSRLPMPGPAFGRAAGLWRARWPSRLWWPIWSWRSLTWCRCRRWMARGFYPGCSRASWRGGIAAWNVWACGWCLDSYMPGSLVGFSITRCRI